MHLLDVGQGDSILLQFANNHQMLIDGGPDDAVINELRTVMPPGDDQIEWVVLSHADKDHLGGLLVVLEAYQVQNVFLNDLSASSRLQENWLSLLQAEGARVIEVKERQGVAIAGGEGLFLPPLKSRDRNNDSLVLRLELEGITLLFTGDIETEREAELLDCCAELLAADILKVGHHGSRTSTTQGFLQAVDPEIALIQAGKGNSYGHPHASVLRRLERAQVRIFRTDEQGRMEFGLSQGMLYKAEPFFEQFGLRFGKKWLRVYNSLHKN